jgi:hypothetical protein
MVSVVFPVKTLVIAPGRVYVILAGGVRTSGPRITGDIPPGSFSGFPVIVRAKGTSRPAKLF